MRRLLAWLLSRTILRFAGDTVTITLKSGAKVRFRCDDNWTFNLTNDGVTNYDLTNTRSMLGTPITVWFLVADVTAIAIRKWRII